MNKLADLEAILFVVGSEGIHLDELAHLLDMSTASAYELVKTLQINYENREESALNILEVGQSFVLTTKKKHEKIIKDLVESPLITKLSQATIETLAIIAYKQPITRIEVDQIRGVQSQAGIQRLLARDLIQELGRADTPGRPIIYTTTDYFMNYFGLKSLEELPSIEDMDIELEEELPTDLFFNKFQAELENEFNEPTDSVLKDKK